MNTAPEPQVIAKETEERPFLPLSQMIQIMPAGTSFGGWGPRLAGTVNIKSWN